MQICSLPLLGLGTCSSGYFKSAQCRGTLPEWPLITRLVCNSGETAQTLQQLHIFSLHNYYTHKWNNVSPHNNKHTFDY